MTGSLSSKRIKLVEEVIGNEDLLLQVLFYLPAKSLIRFKCVSKHWLSLISDPKFCSKHTLLNPVSPTLGIYFIFKDFRGLFSVSLNQSNKKDIPSLAHIKSVLAGFDSDLPKIVHACNGLFLCSYSSKRPYLVCNFTTRTFSILPQHPLPASGGFSNSQSAHLVFDPLESPHYKVVLLGVTMDRHDISSHHDDEYKGKNGYCCNVGCYEIDVYSSETGVWKRMYFRARQSLFHLEYKAVCNGSLHWLTLDKFHGRFDVDTSKLIFIPMPPQPRAMDAHKVRYFGECCGHLFLIFIPWRNAKTFNVLELDQDNNIWKRKYRVNMSPLMAAFPDSFQRPVHNGIVTKSWNFSVLCVVKEDEVNGFALLLAMPEKIVLYNLNRNTFRVLDELPMQEYPSVTRGYNFADTFPFMANLSLI